MADTASQKHLCESEMLVYEPSLLDIFLAYLCCATGLHEHTQKVSVIAQAFTCRQETELPIPNRWAGSSQGNESLMVGLVDASRFGLKSYHHRRG